MSMWCHGERERHTQRERKRERERERERGGRGVYFSLFLALTLISKCMDEHVNDLRRLLKNDIRTISKIEPELQKNPIHTASKSIALGVG